MPFGNATHHQRGRARQAERSQ